MRASRRCAGILLIAVLLAACGSTRPTVTRQSHTSGTGSVGASLPSSAPPSRASVSALPAGGVPRFDHIVIVVLENHAYDEIIGASPAPYLNSLAKRGAVLTRSYAIAHPSQPNYLALFSGTTQGLVDDSCPHSFSGPNLAGSLLSHGQSFAGYAESLPSAGFTGCRSGDYVRKHAPWTNFPDVARKVSLPMSSFPSDPAALPTVSFVIPNLMHDMHDGSVAQSDRWLRQRLAGYASWTTAHNSLLIVTADEDDDHNGNRIATILLGAHVRAGRFAARVTHYGLLRTVLDSCGVAPIGNAAKAAAITGLWTA